MAALIVADHPDWDRDSYGGHSDLNHYRSLYLQDILTAEKGELSSFEKEVPDSLRERDILTQNLNETVGEKAVLG